MAIIDTDLHGLARFYKRQENFGQAESLLTRALAIEEASFGPDHPRVHDTIEDLADLYRAAGRDSEAEAMEQRASRILTTDS